MNSRSAEPKNSVSIAELQALQQISLAEDSVLLQQLQSSRSPKSPSYSSRRPIPFVPKPKEAPPSLRAWRQNRQMEDGEPGSERWEQQHQITRMKQSVHELVHEVQVLQDLMEEDAIEFADNVQTIQDELQLARARRCLQGTPALTAGPSTRHSANSSIAPSATSSPQGTRAVAEVRDAILRDANASRAAGRDMSAQSQPVPVFRMRPLPISMLDHWSSSPDSSRSVGTCQAAFLTALSLIGSFLFKFLAGPSALRLGSVCRLVAAAIHTGSGLRIWPHVEVNVARCAGKIVGALMSSICLQSVCSLSFYGATDNSFRNLWETLCSRLDGGNASIKGIASLQFRCSSKGSAGAMQTMRRHGDSMGIGTESFTLLVARCISEPFFSNLCNLDVGWNHLDDNAMEVFRKGWPKHLSSLCLRWNNIGSKGGEHLAAALASPTAAALRALDVRSNPLGDEGIIAICNGVADHVGLRILGLGETMLTDNGVQPAMKALCGHSTLQALDLGENVLTDAACEAIGAVISSALALSSLQLRGFLFEPRRISDVGGRILVKALARRGPAIQGKRFDMDLDYQQVACGTAVEMARCCAMFARISLMNTDVSTMGAMELATFLRQQNHVADSLRLNVAQCRIKKSAVQLLRNVGLARLDCHGQRVTHQTVGDE